MARRVGVGRGRYDQAASGIYDVAADHGGFIVTEPVIAPVGSRTSMPGKLVREW